MTVTQRHAQTTELAALLLLTILMLRSAACEPCDTKTHALVGTPPKCLPIFFESAQILAPKDTIYVWGNVVAVSASGEFVAVTHYIDLDDEAYVFMFKRRNNGTWTQHGPFLSFPGGRYLGFNQGFGHQMALSNDGRTLVVGLTSHHETGTVLVYRQSLAGEWRKAAIVHPPGNLTANIQFGSGVALSADDNWLAVGCANAAAKNQQNVPEWRRKFAGGTYVFRREGALWKPASGRLVGTGPGLDDLRQGEWVALSNDGSTLAVAGPSPQSKTKRGAVWVFVRNREGKYMQQGPALVGRNGGEQQGATLALSGDGNTLVISAAAFDKVTNATGAYVFSRQGNSWSQQGGRLVGVGQFEYDIHGRSVTIAADGKTVAFGATATIKRSIVGAAFVFVRQGGKWLQLGKEVIGEPHGSLPHQGLVVVLSKDGSTLASAGTQDNVGQVVWVITRERE